MYFSVCTCREGCEPRTSPEECPTHAPMPEWVTTTNVPDDAPTLYVEFD